MEIFKIQPEYYKTPQLQRGSPAFSGRASTINNISPQNMNFGAKADVTSRHLERVKRVERSHLLNCKGISPLGLSSSVEMTQNSSSQSDTFEACNKKTEINPFAAKVLLPALGVLPPIRRVESLPDKLQNNNMEGAIAQVGVAGINLFGDIREVQRAGQEAGQIFDIAKTAIKTKKPIPKASFKNIFEYKGQHAMTMLDGTLAEPLAKKYKCLANLDKTLFDSRFGDIFQKYLGVSFNPENIKIIEIKGFKKFGFNIQDRIVKGINFNGNKFQQLAGKSLLRASLLGVLATCGFEAPALIKSITLTKGTAADKTKAFTKQLIKSAAYVGLITAGIAIAGAMAGPSAIISLVAMAIGSAVSISASNKFNKVVDNIFKKEK